MIRFSSPCQVNSMINVNVLLNLCILCLQIKSNYAKYTIEHCQLVLSDFVLSKSITSN